MPPLIHVEPLVPGAAAVVLQRPERRNALSIALVNELCDAIEQLAAQNDQRVVVVRGAGPVFSAGLDLREALDDALIEKSAAAVKRVLDLLRQTPLVTIAAVHGGAYAGGAGLVAACDIAIAAAGAQIGFPEARRGLLPALISEPLRARVREGDLRYVLLTGELLTAAEAQRLGLVQRVVPDEGLLAEVRRVAELILHGGPETIRRTKTLLNDLYGRPDGAGPADIAALHLSARRSAEAREGLSAFVEKRAPWWQAEQSQ